LEKLQDSPLAWTAKVVYPVQFCADLVHQYITLSLS